MRVAQEVRFDSWALIFESVDDETCLWYQLMSRQSIRRHPGSLSRHHWQIQAARTRAGRDRTQLNNLART